jgi:hypothetical protein
MIRTNKEASARCAYHRDRHIPGVPLVDRKSILAPHIMVPTAAMPKPAAAAKSATKVSTSNRLPTKRETAVGATTSVAVRCYTFTTSAMRLFLQCL